MSVAQNTIAESGLLDINNDKDVKTAVNQVRTEGYFLRCDWGTLARHFLSYFAGGKVFQMQFKDLYNWFMTNADEQNRRLGAPNPVIEQGCLLRLDFNDSPKEEQAFYKALLKRYFHLEALPGQCRESLLDRAEILMRTLVGNKRKCIDEVERLKKISPRDGKEEHNYRAAICYAKKNGDLIDKLCQYIANDLEEDAILKARSNPYFSTGIDYLTLLETRSKKAELGSLNELSNKFGELTLQEFYDMFELYQTDKNAFYSKAEEYLGNRLQQMTDLIRTNQWFTLRKDILIKSIDFYSEGAYQVASSIICLQIEGIITDILVGLGSDAKGLEHQQITNKVHALYQYNVNFFDEEYYSFIFPVLRNRIAHGGAHTTQKEDAIMLMLDLLSICKFAAEEPSLPINALSQIVAHYTLGQTKEEQGEALYDYAKYIVSNENSVRPEFYRFKTEEDKMATDIKETDVMWTWLDGEVCKNISFRSEYVKLAPKIVKKFDVYEKAYVLKKKCLSLDKAHDEEIAAFTAVLKRHGHSSKRMVDG